MLTSQITSISSQSSISPLMIQATSSAMYRRPKLSASARPIGNRQQTRNFRFGLWTRILHQPKEHRRQLKLRYLDAGMCSRKPGSFKHLMQDYVEQRPWETAGFAKRWVNVDALQNGNHRPTKEGQNSERECSGFDAMIDPPFKPFRWGKRCGSTDSRGKVGQSGSQIGRENAESKAPQEQKPFEEEYEYDPVSNRMRPKQRATSNETSEGFPKKVNINTFKGYRSQFKDFKPPSLNPEEDVIHLDGAPNKAELDSYRPSQYNEPDGKPVAPTDPVIDPEFPPEKEELDAYKPFTYNEPEGKSPEFAAANDTPPKEELDVYNEPFSYNERYSEPYGRRPEPKDPVSESLKQYDSKAKEWVKDLPVNDCETSFIGNVDHSESEELLQILKSSSERFDRSKGINAAQSVIDPSFPNDADKYQTPYKYNEPDGKKPEALTDFPEDTHKYGGPFVYKEPFNEPYGHSPETTDSVAESLKEFDSKPKRLAQNLPINDSETSYIGPDRHDFPSQSPRLPTKTPTSSRGRETSASDGFPDDAHKYQRAYRYDETHNEPYGHTAAEVDAVAEGLRDYEQLRKDVKETPKNRSYPSDEYERQFLDGMVSGIMSARSTESSGSGSSQSIVGKPETHTSASSASSSTPFIDEPKPTSQELRSYKAFRYLEPDGHAPDKPDSLSKSLKENDHLSQSTLLNRTKEPALSAEEELPRWKNYIMDKNGFLIEEGSEPFDLDSFLNRSPSRITAFDVADRDRAEDLDLLRSSDIRAKSGISKSKNNRNETDADKESRRKAMEADFKSRTLPGVEMKKPATKKLGAKSDNTIQPRMTGNFVRDFPEEFSTSWSKAGSTLIPADHKVEKVQQDENDYVAGIVNPESYARSGSNPDRIQTSLDRTRINAATKIGNANADEVHRLQAEIDPYSKEPQGLETSYAQEISKQGEGDLSLFVSSYGCNAKNESNQKQKDRELAKEVREIYEDTYGTISPSHRQNQSSNSSQPTPQSEPIPTPEPTLYKILAFEPSSQSIKVATTTSITPDSTTPCTVAEVLMRLSNPAKFFPFFEEMRRDGYEIVSGNGDVLIFRKIRPSIKMPRFGGRNPVDGMSVKPATGNFASPTGFVNHDLPQSNETSSFDTKVAAKVEGESEVFKSNINMKREESVFSGQKKWDGEGEGKDGGRKQMGRGKRMVLLGGVAGGVVYAVGVVGEWMRTGGSDGVGMGGRF